MNEPIATATTAAAGAAGLTLTIAGSIMGLHFDAMFAGFGGALIAQSFVPSTVTRLRAFLQLLGAGGLSGFLSPVGVVVAQKIAPWPLPTDATQLAVGATLGIVAPVVVPLLRKLAVKRGDQ